MATPVGSNTRDRLYNAFGGAMFTDAQLQGLADEIDFAAGGGNGFISDVVQATRTDLDGVDQVTVERWAPGTLFAPARYQKVSGDPGTGAAFQDANGNWFANIEPEVTPEMFGDMGRDPAYAGPGFDGAGWQIAINTQRPIKAMSPTYLFSLGTTPIIPSHGIFWVTGGLGGVKSFIHATPDAHIFGFGFVDFVQWVHLENMGFDGGRKRGTFPYSNNAPDAYNFTAFIDFHADINDPTTGAEIINCVFQNTHVYSWHLTMFHHCRAYGNKYIRTADHGFIACVDVIENGASVEFSSDNGTSISRGCQRVRVDDFLVVDCEVAGFWFAGFNATNSGSVTITGTYTVLGVVSLFSSSTGMFTDQLLPNTFITVFGTGTESCIIKITAVTDGQHATGGVILAVPGSLQGIASTSWHSGPSLGVSDLVATNLLIIGAYADAIAGVTGPKHIEIGNIVARRTGIIADSEVVTTASIAKDTNSVSCALNTGSHFPVDSWIIFRPPTSYQDYFIAQVTGQVGDALTLDRNSPRTYPLEEMRLAHRQTGATGCPINITGNSLGEHHYAEDIDIHDMIASDFVGIGARLGNSGNGSVRSLKLDGIKFKQPGLIQDPAIGTAVIRVDEYRDIVAGVDYPTGNITLTNIEGDDNLTAPFIQFFQRGTAPRKLRLGSNYVPAASSYFAARDTNNRNIDCTINYLTSYQAALTDPTGASATTPGVMMGLGQFRGGTPATGNILFAANPSAAATVTLNGIVWTFVSGTSSGNQTAIQGTLAATLTQLAADLMKSLNTTLALANYTSDATHLLVAYGIGGTVGNAYTLAASVATPSAGTLTSGANDAKPNTNPSLLIAQKTGIYDVTISGNLLNATAGNSMLVSGRYSSAVGAPANGASPIGTVFCSALEFTTPATGIRAGFNCSGRCGEAGDPQVPIGSTIWVDLVVVSPSGTLVSPTDIRVTMRELDGDQIRTP